MSTPPQAGTRWDAIVVGAGHNGLTAGALLARAGLSTLVLERRDVVGGCCVTEEIAPGCCQSRQIRNEYLTAEINAWVSDVCDGRPYWATRTIEGHNHAAEIATVRDSIQDIGGKAALAEALGEPVTVARKQLGQLKTRLANLQKMPDEPDRIVPVQTGLTIAQHWANLNQTGRHAMLESHRVKVRAEQTAAGLVVEFDPGTLLADWVPTVYEDGVAVAQLPELAQPLPVQD